MQSSVPELTDLSKEPQSTFDLYGEEARTPGTFANGALMSRRLVERGVRFVQLYLNNWDHHSNVTKRMPSQCKDIDQATFGLINDLKNRGMFEDTLIIWGGEFGRTVYSQGGLSRENYGRDHHPRCFTMWMAGGGAKGGRFMARRTTFPTTSRATPCMCVISTPPSCTCLELTTNVLRSVRRGWTSGSPEWRRRVSSSNSLPESVYAVLATEHSHGAQCV
jgi:hypothetical protein